MATLDTSAGVHTPAQWAALVFGVVYLAIGAIALYFGTIGATRRA